MPKHKPGVVKLAAVILKKARASNWTAGGEGSREMSYSCNDDMPFGSTSVDYSRWKNTEPSPALESNSPVITVRSRGMSISDSIKMLQEMAQIIPVEIKRLQAFDEASKGMSETEKREIEDAPEGEADEE